MVALIRQHECLWHVRPSLPLASQSLKKVLPQDIDELCTECSNLIDNHEKIQVLSAVHYNLGKTLQDVENIVALPHEAAEAEEMLRDDTQLLQVNAFLHKGLKWTTRRVHMCH